MSGDITSVAVSGVAGTGITVAQRTLHAAGEYTATVELNKSLRY